MTSKKGKEVLVNSQVTKKRGYVSWTMPMDTILISVLYEQLNQGNKGKGEWKSQAYQAIVDEINSKLGMSITTEYARNRLKVWKKIHGQVMEIRIYSKFKWDDDKKMIVVDRDDLKDWIDYCVINPFSKQYGNKVIDHWEDLCVLVGPDRATSDGVEQIEESAAAMDTENSYDTDNGSKGTTSRSNKKMKMDPLANAITNFAQTFKEYVTDKRKFSQPKPSGQEIYEVVSKVYGIQPHQIWRAVKRFMNGTFDEFQMLKDLPEN